MRTRLVVVAALVMTLIAACGGGSRGSPSASTTAGATPSASPPGGITVGRPFLTSTLSTGSSEYQGATGTTITVGGNGTTLHVPNASAGKLNYVYDDLTPSTSNPKQTELRSFAARVTVDTTIAGNLLFGLACQGDLYDVGSSYLLLVDTKGNWYIAKLDQGTFTVLKSGSGAPTKPVEAVQVACAGPVPGMGSNSLRLVIAVDGKILGSDDESEYLACCGVEPYAQTGPSGGTGTVTFRNLKAYTATAVGA